MYVTAIYTSVRDLKNNDIAISIAISVHIHDSINTYSQSIIIIIIRNLVRHRSRHVTCVSLCTHLVMSFSAIGLTCPLHFSLSH